ncbi:MAG: hypothetical protein J6B17_03305 [Ruminococcus sp.]|nr:hypothetical protein [Ruminococcus sp.]
MKKENALIIIFVGVFLLASILGYEMDVESLMPIVFKEDSMTFGFTSLVIAAIAAFAVNFVFNMKEKKS